MEKYISNSEQETIQIGESFGRALCPGDVVFLNGNLGAGKTHFTKGIAKGVGYSHFEHVNSPTFTLVHEIDAPIPLFHFDFYRLDAVHDLDDLGFEEYLKRGIVVIEWADKFASKHLAKHFYQISISHKSEMIREIHMKSIKEFI